MTTQEKTWTQRTNPEPGGLWDRWIEDAYGAPIANVFDGRNADENARLIAAAPALLQALEKLLDNHVRLVNSGDAGFWDPENEVEVQAARAAIETAHGR